MLNTSLDKTWHLLAPGIVTCQEKFTNLKHFSSLYDQIEIYLTEPVLVSIIFLPLQLDSRNFLNGFSVLLEFLCKVS